MLLLYSLPTLLLRSAFPPSLRRVPLKGQAGVVGGRFAQSVASWPSVGDDLELGGDLPC